MKPMLRILLVILAAMLAAGCTQTKAARRYGKDQAAKALKTLDQSGLLIGEFPLEGKDAVLDGDTIQISGLDSTLRLVGVDTEETFKKDWERKAYAKGFEVYVKELRGNSPRPVKMATPLGEEAKQFAKHFFDGVHKVRLERDHPGEIRCFYGRYLAYVFVERDGKWLNYNVEAIRAGMSPYYMKYGYSRRFHKEMVEAEAQARAAKIGIWDTSKEHYPDYDERLAWWKARGDVIQAFEQEAAEHDNYVALTRWDAMLELERRVGKEVVVLGSVGDVKLGDQGPSFAKLVRNRTTSFDIVFFDKGVFKASGIASHKGEYLAVRGVVKRFKVKRTGEEKLEIIVSLPGQVFVPGSLPSVAPLVSAPEPAASQAPAPEARPAADRPPPKVEPLVPEVSAGGRPLPVEEPQKTPPARPEPAGANEPDEEEIPGDLNFDDLAELPSEP